ILKLTKKEKKIIYFTIGHGDKGIDDKLTSFKKYIEEEKSAKEIQLETNLDLELIRNVIKTVNKNEYKRRQAPIGAKITFRSFGKERRYPITNKFSPL
ncbi:MAG: hypothetical protein ACP5PT_07960, partial [Brevinematia bacterium]